MDSSHIIALFLSLGIFGMAAIALIEKFAPVVPSYVLLMLLGMTVPNWTALLMATLATAAGSLTGAIAWYGIGRALGAQRVESVVGRFGKYAFFNLRNYERIANAYRRNHFWVTLIGQGVPIARIYLALPAGVFKLQLVPFAAAAGLGILLWNTPFLTLGYLLRDGGHDPVDLGFWVSGALFATEMAIGLGLRMYGNIFQRSKDQNRSSAVSAQMPELADASPSRPSDAAS